MNSGLPLLLDAIFGRQDLDSVSLEEMYELIKEFPSFNAGHFLLSKKLKLENTGASYERETMRTALYFNNPFWLQSVLNDDYHPGAAYPKPEYSDENGRDHTLEDNYPEESLSTLSVDQIREKLSEPEPTIHTDLTEVPFAQTEEFFKEELRDSNSTVPEPALHEEKSSEFDSRPVMSFDDLISKYHIEPVQSIQGAQTESTMEIIPTWTEETPKSSEPEIEEKHIPDPLSKTTEEPLHDQSIDIHPEEDNDSFELREEVFNEYGIFEEVIVKKTDFDLEAFDRPDVPVTTLPEELVVGIQNEAQPEHDIPAEAPVVEDVSELENETIVENPVSEDPADNKQVESDYEAFDRPIETNESDELQEGAKEFTLTDRETHPNFTQEDQRTVDTTGDGDSDEEKDDPSWNATFPGLVARFDEQQKARVPFDPKKAESIVFAPYHMIDYFASQGIKLVLEENPVDPFGRQLKSFTDWLKVMKKIPSQPAAEKTDDREVDRIRHFAAHSVDEREILTESMAEVLAKQGMYENAIALYQKLSLIYPPKSAYFASRIEQLKASLP
jgi:hypothetical protein